jgi:hypothetical protein
MKFARRLFLIAGIYGLVDLIPQYFTEARLGIAYAPPITHPEYFYGFIGVAIAWQVLFLVIARDPVRYRIAMLAAVLEKLAFGVPAVALFAQGRLAAIVLAFGIVDLVFALLFLVAYLRTPRRLPPSAAAFTQA